MAEADAIERVIEHRPWPLPSIPWVMFQSWRDLLFAHWPLPAEAIRPLVPAPLALEEHGGSAWLCVTPFRITGLRARWLPAIPGVSEFPEMNLRTYVRHGGRPGIFFLSLDADSRLAVLAARVGFRLPYRRAEMRVTSSDGWLEYDSRRVDDPVPADFSARYHPTGPAFTAAPDTLEHFLTERYAFYTVLRDGTVLRGDIHHVPWPLQPAEADIRVNTVPAAHGIELPDAPPLLHFAARQDTLIWPPQAV